MHDRVEADSPSWELYGHQQTHVVFNTTIKVKHMPVLIMDACFRYFVVLGYTASYSPMFKPMLSSEIWWYKKQDLLEF